MELKESVSQLHLLYGASIPREYFTNDIYNLLQSFKASYTDDWLDNEYFFALANIDRYNTFYKGKSNG